MYNKLRQRKAQQHYLCMNLMERKAEENWQWKKRKSCSKLSFPLKSVSPARRHQVTLQSHQIWGNESPKACEKARVRSCCEKSRSRDHWNCWSRCVCTQRWRSWRRLVRIQHGGQTVIWRTFQIVSHLLHPAEEMFTVKPENNLETAFKDPESPRSGKTLTKMPTKLQLQSPMDQEHKESWRIHISNKPLSAPVIIVLPVVNSVKLHLTAFNKTVFYPHINQPRPMVQYIEK